LIADYAPGSQWAGKAAQNWVTRKAGEVTALLRKYGR
jgi:hypothetical protein